MKNCDEKFVLTLTREQASIVEDACELYARLKIGQFNRITEMMLRVSASEDYCFRREIANNILKSAACIIFGMNAYGMPDCKQDTEHHRAWDVYQVLRYTRSWHDHPEGGFTVNFDKPMTFIGEPLPECEIVEGSKDGKK